jgi:rapamycin-insensitive companion of mTOR
VNVMGESLGFSLPMDFNKLFSLQPFAAREAFAPVRSHLPRELTLNTSSTTVDPLNAEILRSVTKLGNTVLTNKAVAELNSLKHRKKAAGFLLPGVFKQALEVLAGHRYGVMQWRFVIDLFDKGVLRKIVLEEEEEGEEESSSEEEGTDSE